MAEETVTFARIKEREKGYINFYSALLTELRAMNPFPIRSISPDGASWLMIAGLPQKGGQVGTLVFSFARNNRLRIELYIQTGDKERNKRIFNALHIRREEIEAALGQRLSWERLDDRQASRVALYLEGSITDDEEQLIRLRGWAVEAMVQFEKVIGPVVGEVSNTAESIPQPSG
jgi:hypothetical protein